MPPTTNAGLDAGSDPVLVRYARRLSHDLNNFGTVIRTYSELLLSDVPADSPFRPDLEEIQRAVDSMVDYLQRVTRFSRAGVARRTPVSLSDALLEAVDRFEQQQAARQVIAEGLDTDIEVLADPLWLSDIVLELLHNAHEAATGDTPVRVSLQTHAGHAIVGISNIGPGFVEMDGAPGEPFASSRVGVRGAGHGLALVAAYVHTLGGQLEFAQDSDTTRVTMQLPALHRSAPNPQLPTPNPALNASLHGPPPGPPATPPAA